MGVCAEPHVNASEETLLLFPPVTSTGNINARSSHLGNRGAVQLYKKYSRGTVCVLLVTRSHLQRLGMHGLHLCLRLRVVGLQGVCLCLGCQVLCMCHVLSLSLCVCLCGGFQTYRLRLCCHLLRIQQLSRTCTEASRMTLGLQCLAVGAVAHRGAVVRLHCRHRVRNQASGLCLWAQLRCRAENAHEDLQPRMRRQV